jgi:hypothetical protein
MQPLTPEPQGAGLGAPPFVRPFVAHLEGFSASRALFALPVTGSRVTGVTGRLTCGYGALKSLGRPADREVMTRQVHQVTTKVKRSPQPFGQELTMGHAVSREILHAALMVAENAPDPRRERVTIAIAHLHAGTPDANVVAQAMIARILEESGK